VRARHCTPTEADILKTIVDYLELHRILYLRHNPVSVVSDKHGRARGFRKVRESQRGAPDLIMWSRWHAGYPAHRYCLAIEVKAPKGQLSCYQQEWQRKAIAVGLQYIVVRSFEEFIEEIE